MSDQATPPLSGPQAKLALVSLLHQVADSFKSMANGVNLENLSPESCAYIDRRLAVVIAKLASARSIVITHGQLSPSHLDGGDDWNLDDEIVIAEDGGDAGGKGGAA